MPSDRFPPKVISMPIALPFPRLREEEVKLGAISTVKLRADRELQQEKSDATRAEPKLKVSCVRFYVIREPGEKIRRERKRETRSSKSGFLFSSGKRRKFPERMSETLPISELTPRDQFVHVLSS